MSTDDTTVEEADLGPETTVWTTTMGPANTSSRTLHLDKECHRLQCADIVQPKDLIVYPPGHQRWCSACTDEIGEVAVRE